MKRLFALCFLACFVGTANAQQEVIYHVFQRSFFDSNGDGHGDLKGMEQKLTYLKELGVTTILLTPLYHSDFYHNYFADDFEKIDPNYGTLKEYKDLIKAAHGMKLKIYQDVEMQYVTGKHPWFQDSYKNPKSQYSDFIYYDDKANEKPWFFMGIPEFATYNNNKEQLVVVNMKSQKVKDYTLKMLKYWADPNGDGKFDDGVDGYRLDHMMDNLDNSGKLTGLFKDFWTPIVTDLKKLNPELQILAEQADSSSYGHEHYTKGNVDRVFAFRLKQAIASFDKAKISAAADSTFNYQPKDKHQVIFIENHDTGRFASEPGMNIGKLKVGAALNILMGGIPSIYYGQELGMKGQQLKGMTDGNDIPVREAFEWYAAEDGQGMALWYKNTGEWWDKRNMKANDGISLEEQRKDPNSLWSYYKELLRLKRLHPALAMGTYAEVPNNNDKVLSFIRTHELEKVFVMINLSDKPQIVTLGSGDEFSGVPQAPLPKVDNLKLLSGTPNAVFKRGGRMVTLNPYSIQVWRIF